MRAHHRVYNWILYTGYTCGYTKAAGALTDSPKYKEAARLVEAEKKWRFGFADWRTTTGGERQVRSPLVKFVHHNKLV